MNDIQKSISGNPVKNGSSVMSATPAGKYSTYNYYVKNTPDINTIQAKYDDRFYNGIFVQLVDNQTVVGG